MWDFAGQNQFKDISTNFGNGTNSAFILFDLSRISPFKSVEEWFEQLNQYRNISVFILGTKSDFIDPTDCRINDDYVSEPISKSRNIFGNFKISSKIGSNVKKALNSLLDIIPENA